MYLLMNEFSGVIQSSHLIDKETECQPNLTKIMALDCDEKAGPGAEHQGRGVPHRVVRAQHPRSWRPHYTIRLRMDGNATFSLT